MKLRTRHELILLAGARQVEDDEARDIYFARVADVLRPNFEILGWAFGAGYARRRRGPRQREGAP